MPALGQIDIARLPAAAQVHPSGIRDANDADVAPDLRLAEERIVRHVRGRAAEIVVPVHIIEIAAVFHGQRVIGREIYYGFRPLPHRRVRLHGRRIGGLLFADPVLLTGVFCIFHVLRVFGVRLRSCGHRLRGVGFVAPTDDRGKFAAAEKSGCKGEGQQQSGCCADAFSHDFLSPRSDLRDTAAMIIAENRRKKKVQAHHPRFFRHKQQTGRRMNRQPA